jgi:hypothetical protein
LKKEGIEKIVWDIRYADSAAAKNAAITLVAAGRKRFGKKLAEASSDHGKEEIWRTNRRFPGKYEIRLQSGKPQLRIEITY